MSRNPKNVPLPAGKFKSSTSETVEMTEIDGMGQGAVLQYTNVGRFGKPSEAREVKTCIGDLYVIINALRDYANLLEGVIPEWELTGFHAAKYEQHAARCRKIAQKYASAIGYKYDKALERCRRRRARGERIGDTGLDGLEALARKREINPPKKDKEQEADDGRNDR